MRLLGRVHCEERGGRLRRAKRTERNNKKYLSSKRTCIKAPTTNLLGEDFQEGEVE